MPARHREHPVSFVLGRVIERGGANARAWGIDQANLSRALRGERRLLRELKDAQGDLLNTRVVDGSASARKRDAT